MFASADTNFLLGLAAQEEDAVDAAETLRRRAPHLLISATPTPLEELRFFKVQSQDLELKAAAAKALASFRSVWGFHAVSLTSSQQERVEQVADRIRQVGILPREERHDSFILVESALISANLLVTRDSLLRSLDYARPVFELGEFGLNTPVLATPREIIRKFFR